MTDKFAGTGWDSNSAPESEAEVLTTGPVIPPETTPFKLSSNQQFYKAAEISMAVVLFPDELYDKNLYYYY
ncbi:jg14590 [Pararge aegeria aegeria]|uniref:Jg14590 protein n=1 Tax=Pararge aegeria aegeria TaxID=348720 RepID=A0A8S4R2P7_9NEOP|nr:jg14590 [Pararge aegeria aegeria]